MKNAPKAVPHLSEKDKERITSQIENKGPDECWEWTGNKARGYGQIMVGGKVHKAHRLAYFIAHGAFDWSMFVCHTCDNPSCCNPSHLFLGTCSDNFQDMLKKGRANKASGDRHGMRLKPERRATGDRHGSKTHPESTQKGVKHWNTKITEDNVRVIRSRCEAGEYHRVVAKDYGLSRQTIGDIASRKKWSHVV